MSFINADTNIFLILAYYTPILFVIIISIVNIIYNKFDSLSIYIVGGLLLQIFNMFISTTSYVKNKVLVSTAQDILNNKCRMFKLASVYLLPNRDILAPSILFIIYTLVYSIFSMIANNTIDMVMLIPMILLTINHIYQYIISNCITKGVLTLLSFSGCLFAIIWSFIFYSLNNELLLFNNNVNKNKCGKADGKQFKCKVYKNGELIS